MGVDETRELVAAIKVAVGKKGKKEPDPMMIVDLLGGVAVNLARIADKLTGS